MAVMVIFVGREGREEIEKGSTEIRRQRERTTHCSRPRQVPIAGGQGRSTARSTDVHNVHSKRAVDRPRSTD